MFLLVLDEYSLMTFGSREFFHNHDWSKATIEEFIKALDDYLKWFKIKRIKERLGYLSPMDYRASLGY
ncbi:MAG: IS3 family transposase [Bacilli bacterium]|nr:IS3 family transposase [Bacilli bacterium]